MIYFILFLIIVIVIESIAIIVLINILIYNRKKNASITMKNIKEKEILFEELRQNEKKYNEQIKNASNIRDFVSIFNNIMSNSSSSN